MIPAFSSASLWRLALATALVAGASAIGQIATAPALVDWSPSLTKPAFTPPNWLFPVAWTTLYLLMAFAFWRILRLDPAMPGRKPALILFLIQLVLNALWSWAFFGLRSPAAGFAVVLVLDLAVGMTLLRFQKLDRPAALALVPYLGWILFATALNGAILVLT